MICQYSWSGTLQRVIKHVELWNVDWMTFWETLFLIKTGVPWQAFLAFSFAVFSSFILLEVSEGDLKTPEIYAAGDWGMGLFSCVGRPRRERSEACVYYRSGFTEAVHLQASRSPLAMSLQSARLPIFQERGANLSALFRPFYSLAIKCHTLQLKRMSSLIFWKVCASNLYCWDLSAHWVCIMAQKMGSEMYMHKHEISGNIGLPKLYLNCSFSAEGVSFMENDKRIGGQGQKHTYTHIDY